MCSPAVLCDTRWVAAQQDHRGSRISSSDLNLDHNKNADDADNMSESPELDIEFQDCSESGEMLTINGDIVDDGPRSVSSPQHVARQDSGVPEDTASPCAKDSTTIVDGQPREDDDPDGTMNSDGNVTVIHVTIDDRVTDVAAADPSIVVDDNRENEASSRDFTPEGKDSKDGSDSGVEGCASELPRVEYASSFNGLDEVSCDSSLVSCCSVYEDTCAILPDDSRMTMAIHGSSGGGIAGSNSGSVGGEGTSEGGSESSSVAGSVGPTRSARSSATSAKRNSFASSNSSNVSSAPSKRKNDSIVGKIIGIQSIGDNNSTSRGSTSQRTKIRGTTTSSTPRATSISRSGTSGGSSRDRGRSREGRSTTREIVKGGRHCNESKNEVSSAVNKTSIVNNERRGSSSTKFRSSEATTIGLPSSVTVRTRTRPLPDSLPSVLTTEIDRDLAAQRGRSSSGVSRSRGGSCGSRGRGGTPASTPSEDGRKSILSGSTNSKNCNLRSDRSGPASLDDKTIETYATLPRRSKNNFVMVKSVDRGDEIVNAKIDGCRSSSRDASLSRSSTAKKPNRVGGSRDVVATRKCLPPYPRSKVTEKIRIYQETSSQTGLTCDDVEKALAGVYVRRLDPEISERFNRDCQTEDTWEDHRVVQTQLKNVSDEAARLKLENERLEAERSRLDGLLMEERADHAFARKELDRNARRVLAMLGTPQSEQAEGSDSFLELETHFQSSGQVVADQQIEIADLQSLCRMLNRDLEKSLAAQKSLLQQEQELEAESTEMLDFLQEEKATLAEALKDAETEIVKKDELLAQRDKELVRLTEECKHLVRISEQRRQENLSLGMKLNAVERRGRDLLLGQGAAVSGASVALSGLGTRLDGLVDQLVRSYKISEKDLEDVVYHNEAYSRSNSSAESSPISSRYSVTKECTPSPKRGSFVSAVIGAIRNAANHPFATRPTAEKKPSPVESTKHIFKELSTESSSDLLDFETEPCIMMESVLEDVPLADTYTHNMISSSDSLRRALSVPEPIDDTNSRPLRLTDECTSLTNLTQAILNRRRAEDEEDVDDCDSPSESDGGEGTESNSTAPVTDYSPAVNLVDQVIDVDNLVTKLLKVLRIIQLDNDTCIRELRDDKTDLESKLEDNNRELEGLRKPTDNKHLNCDEIFADDRRRTVVENRRKSLSIDEENRRIDEDRDANRRCDDVSS